MARDRIGVLIDPEDGGAGHAYYNNRTTRPTAMDTNILIITSALFAVLILALCMHFTIRWVLSHFYHVTPSHADSAPTLFPPSSSTGLLKSHVDSLPTTLYTKNDELALRLDASSATQCPICFDDFADGDRIRVLPNCQHGFHVACIDTWLAKHTSCPTCRGSLMNALPAEVLPSHVRLHILITKGTALPPTIP